MGTFQRLVVAACLLGFSSAPALTQERAATQLTFDRWGLTFQYPKSLANYSEYVWPMSKEELTGQANGMKWLLGEATLQGVALLASSAPGSVRVQLEWYLRGDEAVCRAGCLSGGPKVSLVTYQWAVASPPTLEAVADRESYLRANQDLFNVVFRDALVKEIERGRVVVSARQTGSYEGSSPSKSVSVERLTDKRCPMVRVDVDLEDIQTGLTVKPDPIRQMARQQMVSRLSRLYVAGKDTMYVIDWLVADQAEAKVAEADLQALINSVSISR